MRLSCPEPMLVRAGPDRRGPDETPDWFKRAQRQAWDAAAPGWERWWPVIERGAQIVSERLMGLAEIRPGSVVADVATGTGEPAITAAIRAGPEGFVLATDISPRMLEIARGRAARLCLTNIAFVEGDADTIGLEPGRYDALTSRWGFMFLPDPGATARRLSAALAPGGRFAIAAWGPAARVPLLTVAITAARRILDVPIPDRGAPDVFSLSGEGAIASVLSSAGLARVHSHTIATEVILGSPAEYAALIRDTAGPLAAIVDRYDPGVQAEIWRAVASAAAGFMRVDGTIKMENDVIVAVGTKP